MKNTSSSVIPVIPKVNVSVDDRVDDSVQCLNGCLVDGVCKSYGYRSSDSFCDTNGVFSLQKDAKGVCSDNYECQSNMCASHLCVRSSFVTTIINLLRRLFGLS